ncbi:hypothetical protein FNF27_08194 [Cafeteria roenbergensis]|uniref:Post-GPI attachment to proteins factor 3 n=1 Tax=Cafeteria roenbergensis TaxID=33653 RepID=A0A5A8D6G4_CAFRO|nr:hypothetical protein FNF27_08194 [Cafeteria roenbergensis]
MNWVRFDYGLNMTASVAVAAVTNLMWCVWAARQGCCSARHPTAWKAPAAAVLLSAMAMLELLDFAPIGDLVDRKLAVAHGHHPPLLRVVLIPDGPPARLPSRSWTAWRGSSAACALKKFECTVTSLAEPVDVYASWIDACEATAKEGADGSGAAGMLDDL